MFSSAYKSVQPPDPSASEAANDLGIPVALAVLKDAVDRCVKEDVRTDDVYATLEFLKSLTMRHYVLNRFRRCLDLPDIETRPTAVSAAYEGIVRIFRP